MDKPRPSIKATIKEKVKNLVWSLDMDNCLIEALVKQATLGNKIDKAFKGPAYMAASRAINEKFGLKINAQHIKNRMKTIRKNFAMLKDLMNADGFSWNDTTKMIEAKPEVWNTYIKAHPEAKLWRRKSITNFDDLVIVCGTDQATVRYARTPKENIAAEPNTSMDPDEQCLSLERDGGLGEFDGLEIDKPQPSTEASSKEKVKNLVWSLEMDNCLIEALVEQATLGNKIDKAFKGHAYTAASSSINAKFDIEINAQHIKNRMKTIKKNFAVLKDLMNANGFGLNDATKMVEAEPEVWNSYIKAHPEAKLWRRKSITNISDLVIVCGTDQVMRSYARIPKENVVAEPNTNIDPDEQYVLLEGDRGLGEFDNVGDSTTQQNPSIPSLIPPAPRCSMKRARTNEADDDAILANCMLKLVNTVGQMKCTKAIEAKHLYAEILKTEGVDDSFLVRAFDYVCTDESRTRIYLTMEPKLRKQWLLYKLGHDGVF